MQITAPELKGLKSRLEKHRSELRDLQRIAAEADTAKLEKARAVSSLEAEIRKLTEKRPEPVVSEHAMLRYIQRVIGIDTSGYEQEILSQSVRSQAAAVGNGRFPASCHDVNFDVLIKDNVVVTVETYD